MEVKNCKGCNRLFQYIGGMPLCPACRDELEDKFAVAKEFIYSNPGASIPMVAEAADVSIKQIKQWIREDRLMLSEPSADGVLCEHCGVPICSGRYCDKCKVKMTEGFKATIGYAAEPAARAKKDSKSGNKMRFLS